MKVAYSQFFFAKKAVIRVWFNNQGFAKEKVAVLGETRDLTVVSMTWKDESQKLSSISGSVYLHSILGNFLHQYNLNSWLNHLALVVNNSL